MYPGAEATAGEETELLAPDGLLMDLSLSKEQILAVVRHQLLRILGDYRMIRETERVQGTRCLCGGMAGTKARRE